MTALRDYAAAIAQPTLTAARAPLRRGGRPRRRPAAGVEAARRDRGPASTAADLRRVDGEIVRFLADDGVTYAPAGGASPAAGGSTPCRSCSTPRPGRELEVGLAQRTELLNALLVDLYGEQRLLSDGVVPAAAVVFGHAGFTRDRRPRLAASTRSR